MPTGSQIAYFTDKRISGFVDFETRFLRYLQNQNHEAVKRLFVEGSFAERMPLSASIIDTVTLDLKAVLGDGYAHDGGGRIFDFSQIDRNAIFENTNSATYEVGAKYIEAPEEIRINPRTGKPEYSYFVEEVGREAVPNSVTNNGSNLTLEVTSLFEQGGSPGNHAGRTVRVFLLIPDPGGLTPSVAIEEVTVYYGGGINQIDTTGLFGQTTVSTTAADYVVQLVGLTVFKDTATNRPSQDEESFFAGTVVGSGPGNVPGATDNALQTIIEAKAASDVTIGALVNWADGTTNPATVVQTAVEKIVLDLTSPVGQGGVGKIFSPALGAWADATLNPADTLRTQLLGIVSALTSTSGARGGGKITSAALTGTPFSVPAQRLDQVVQAILTHVNSIFTRVNTLTRGVIVNPPAADEGMLKSAVGPSDFSEVVFLIAQVPSVTGKFSRLYSVGSPGAFLITHNAYWDTGANLWNADSPGSATGNRATAFTIGGFSHSGELELKSDTTSAWGFSSWDTSSPSTAEGNMLVPGDFNYSNVKSKTVVISLSDGISDGGWTFDIANNRWEATINLAKLVFPIPVPSRCVITAFRVWAEAGDATGNGNFLFNLLYRTYNFGAPSVTPGPPMGSVGYGAGSGTKVVEDASISGGTIDRLNNEYFLEITASSNAGSVSDFIHGIQLTVNDVGPRNL